MPNQILYSLFDGNTGQIILQAYDFDFVAWVALKIKKKYPDSNYWIM